MSQTLDHIFNQLGIPQDAIDQARQRQANQGGTLRENLIALDFLNEERFAQKVDDHFRVPYVHPHDISIADDALALLPRDKAEKYFALPLELDPRHRRLTIAMADPSDMSTLDELKFIIGHTLLPRYTPEDELSEAIRQEYSRFEDTRVIAEAWSAEARPSAPLEQTPVIDVGGLATGETALAQLIGAIFSVAYSKGASEISLEPNIDGIRVCLRIDGKFSEIAQFPKNLQVPILTRIRRILGFDVGERSNIIQKGFALVKLQNKKELDISYHIYPTIHDEAILIKVKDRFTIPAVENLTFAPTVLETLQKVLRTTHGLVLVAGTAKSGVTTTLYALLNTLNKPSLNILSFENPVETLIQGITQGQFHNGTGQTYAHYFSSLAGQRPDVVMVDKIFDETDFQEVIRLASSSLVFSTIPSIDAASAVVKLALMGSPEAVATYVTCIIAQRLVRKICDACKEEVILPDQHREKLGLAPDDRCYSGKGCELCANTGYKGRLPIFELMLFTDGVKQAVMESPTAHELRIRNAEQHVFSLRDDGMRKVKQGVTTLQEVLKATML